MRVNLPLTIAGYALALYLMFVPLWETLFGVVPIDAGDAGWRYGATGILTQALMTPLLGLLVASGIAYALGHARIMRILAVLSGFTALAFLVLLPMYVMDAPVVRVRFETDPGAAMTVGTTTAVLKMLLTVVIAGSLAKGGWGIASAWAEEDAGPSIVSSRSAAT